MPGLFFIFLSVVGLIVVINIVKAVLRRERKGACRFHDDGPAISESGIAFMTGSSGDHSHGHGHQHTDANHDQVCDTCGSSCDSGGGGDSGGGSSD